VFLLLAWAFTSKDEWAVDVDETFDENSMRVISYNSNQPCKAKQP